MRQYRNGEIIEIEERETDGEIGKKRYKKIKLTVIKHYRHFVLCQHPGGYRITVLNCDLRKGNCGMEKEKKDEIKGI